MGKSCCVCHRRSGKVGCGEEIHLFTVPKAIDLFNKWRDAISVTGILLKKTHSICHKHFNPDQIKDQVTVHDQYGKVLFQRQYQKVHLMKGAIPSIFESSDNILESDNAAVIREPLFNITNSPADPLLNENDNLLKIQQTPETAVSSNMNDVDCMIVTTETDLIDTEVSLTSTFSDIANEVTAQAPQISLFNILYEGAITPQLPHSGWSISIQKLPKLIVFAELGQSSAGTVQAPWFVKQITLDEQMNVQIFIFNKFAHTAAMSGDCNSILQLENIIAQIDQSAVCSGGPPAMHYRNVQTRCAYKDMSSTWRHNSCTLTIETGSTCKSCASLDSILRKHLACKKTINKQHIPLSPSRKKNIDILRKAKRVQAQALKRTKRSLYSISQEVNKLHDKLAHVEESTFEENLKKLNLPDAQLIMTEKDRRMCTQFDTGQNQTH